jgi:hypothetical protein
MKRETYHDTMGRMIRETRGRPTKFPDGRKTMAVDFDTASYNRVAELSKEFTEKSAKQISKGELVRTAVDFWLENNSPYSMEL